MKYEADNKIIEKALGQFFYKCDGVVGAEANYQAMLASELEDVFPGRVRRERKLAQTGRGGVDVIVLGMENPDYVFELKVAPITAVMRCRMSFRRQVFARICRNFRN